MRSGIFLLVMSSDGLNQISFGVRMCNALMCEAEKQTERDAALCKTFVYNKRWSVSDEMRLVRFFL